MSVEDLGLRDAMLAALAVGAVLLLVYQVFMLVWTKRTVGSIPKSIVVLRGINIAALLVGCAFVIWNLAR